MKSQNIHRKCYSTLEVIKLREYPGTHVRIISPTILHRTVKDSETSISYRQHEFKYSGYFNEILIGDIMVDLSWNDQRHITDTSERKLKRIMKKYDNSIDIDEFISEITMIRQDLIDEKTENKKKENLLEDYDFSNSPDNLFKEASKYCLIDAVGLESHIDIHLLSDMSTFSNHRSHAADLGKAGQGKTHILEVTNSIYPDEYTQEFGTHDTVAYFKRMLEKDNMIFAYKIMTFYDIGSNFERENKDWMEVIKQMLSGDKLKFNLTEYNSESNTHVPLEISGDRHGSIRLAMVDFFKDSQMQSRVLRLNIPSDKTYNQIVEDKQFSIPGLNIKDKRKLPKITDAFRYLMMTYEHLERNGYHIYYLSNLAKHVYYAMNTMKKFPQRERNRAIALLSGRTFLNMKNNEILYSPKHKIIYFIPSIRDVRDTIDVYNRNIPYLYDSKGLNGIIIEWLEDYDTGLFTRKQIEIDTGVTYDSIAEDLEILYKENILTKKKNEVSGGITYDVQDFSELFEEMKRDIKIEEPEVPKIQSDRDKAIKEIINMYPDTIRLKGIVALNNKLGVSFDEAMEDNLLDELA